MRLNTYIFPGDFIHLNMNSMKVLRLAAILLILGSVSTRPAAALETASTPPRYNILFLFVDDLRPELGAYGQKHIHSPHINSLAARSTIFTKHYVTVPTCGASRSGILTGLRPRSAAELSNNIFAQRQAGTASSPQPESFVQHLRENGYYTVGIGKISHSADGYIYPYTGTRSDKMELPGSWDEMLFDPGKWGTGWNAFFGYADGNNRNDQEGQVKPYEAGAVADTGYPDGLTATLAIQKLQQLALAGKASPSAPGQQKPFFLGVGFFKPHLPFNAPQQYWDLYDENELPLTPSPGIPQYMHPASLQPSGEFNAYKKGEEKASLSTPVSDAYARRLRHAYFAAISYVDAQIGRVIAELKRLQLDRHTIIVLWGDHGWHLGDDLVWGKHTLTEWATRSPLIIQLPEQKQAVRCDKVVSSVDVYPTLMDLCGLSMPYTGDGRSLVPLLHQQGSAWEEAAFSYYNKGLSLRTPRYRLTRYAREQQPTIELYDHDSDPFENINVAAENPEIVQELLKTWEKENTLLPKR